MPNICEGILKIRGKWENIKEFLVNEIVEVQTYDLPYTEKGTERPPVIKDEYGSFSISTNMKYNILYFKNSSREWFGKYCGSSRIEFYHDSEEEYCTVCVDYYSAWQVPEETLLRNSQKYSIDFRIYAFERGMQFNQEVIIADGEVVKNEIIRFSDYDWECINPTLGG